MIRLGELESDILLILRILGKVTSTDLRHILSLARRYNNRQSLKITAYNACRRLEGKRLVSVDRTGFAHRYRLTPKGQEVVEKERILSYALEQIQKELSQGHT